MNLWSRGVGSTLCHNHWLVFVHYLTMPSDIVTSFMQKHPTKKWAYAAKLLEALKSLSKQNIGWNILVEKDSKQIFSHVWNRNPMQTIICKKNWNKMQQQKRDSAAAAQSGFEVERAQFCWARAEIKLWVSSLAEPEPVKISLKPALSSSFSLIKMAKFELEPTSSFSVN